MDLNRSYAPFRVLRACSRSLQLATTWQDRTRIVQAVARHIVIGIFYGALWWRLGIGRISERVGLVFFSLVFVTLGNQQNIPRIFQDRLLFYREKGAGVYGATAYWWSIVFSQVSIASCFFSNDPIDAPTSGPRFYLCT